MFKYWFSIPLWQRVIGALVLGTALGLWWGPGAENIKWIGDLFIKAIKMLIVPLIFFSLISGIAALGDLKKLGSVGGKALLLFAATALISVTLGVTLGNIFQPGIGLEVAMPEGLTDKPPPVDWIAMVLRMIPDNPIMTMAEGNVLPLIVFAMLVGISVLMAGEEAAPIVRGVDAGAVVMQRMTLIVMELAPFGVFALMAWVAGTFGWASLIPLAKVVALNYAGCFIIILLVYPAIIKFIAKLPIIDFFRGIVDAQVVAFSTASSNAALPVTLRCVQRNLGVSRSVSSFVVALGATINMNGTAMYLGLVAVFGAQIYGIDLTVTSYILIGLTATLGSIGAAGIPGSGLIMLGLVLGTIGVPLETIAFVAGINHIMDMMRTMNNVTGDATVAVAVGRMAGEIDVEEYVSDDDI
ncbi:dicarboxylate/amino acid:cation symporter [Pontixanthobacter aquaemixtae]|uniref:Cation:dicarboxylase symporter family transporter n=1 Tax=Pontixanthobacter aquaemixtae TaxID=1958940 RepID=A0A844ZVQ4_9SPHN|nr:dicarboxylate/amino acid:cation symporter [Pontixanthobacter aquaemixtae]MXO90837.1 cation:dicarboxylase symporter family transporter [Pontixanthobacter aquaemixtae]